MPCKKVAYLASEYPGISHTFIFREIQSLREVGFDVKTASIRRPANLDKMTEKEKADAAQTLYIKDAALVNICLSHLRILLKSPLQYFHMLKEAVSLARRGPRNFLMGLAYFAEAGILLNWLMKNRTRHVHVHFANPAATVAMIAAAYGTMEFSISIHGPDIFYNVDTSLLKEKVCRASFIRCISYYCQSQLMRLVDHHMWDKFHIVRCGIDPGVFAPRPEPQNEIPEILCVGRLVPAKGQHILLDACSILNKQGIAFHLTYVGDGEDRSSLEKLTNSLGLVDKVTFTGAVGQDDVHQYYNRADLFVLASFAEGVPVVLMEAMAKQIACVTTRITGHPELIEDGKDGVLVAPSDAGELAVRLGKLLADSSLRQEFGKKGREKVLKRYDLAANCKMMAGVFEKYTKGAK
ncbi:MAG: colanic acid biosynthesis glycosyltransferase WcaL [Desulfobacteraceae bacterium 4572_123]|nr:MAG: colanic acid biosynthesis glycosyltransferase WcaL [Desulfobacteraceae bacterium 4572_123]